VEGRRFADFQHRALVELREDNSRVDSHFICLQVCISSKLSFFSLCGLSSSITSLNLLWCIRGCYFQEGATIRTEMSVENAFRRSMRTLTYWISREVNLSKTRLIFRAYAPVHFRYLSFSHSHLSASLLFLTLMFYRGGDWKTGGSCHLETIPDLSSFPVSSKKYVEYRTVVDGLSEHLRAGSVELLNVTVLTSRRKDGHSSLYYLGPTAGPAPLHRQDCSHWCLPGVPDAWNELLYAMFLKRERLI